MAKMNPMFSFSGTFNEVTQVRSKLYGKHIRSRRGSKKPALINAAFQKSVELNKLANPVAKAIKDALAPFREGFHDGSMWGRLVGLFKKHFRQYPNLDLSILQGFEVYREVGLSANYNLQTEVNIVSGAEQTIRIRLLSSAMLKLEKYTVSNYRQTLIAVFLDAELRTTTQSESVMFPLAKKMTYDELLKEENWIPVGHEQIVHWPIPSGAKTVLIVVTFEPYRDGKSISRMKIKGISPVKVVALQAE